MDQNTSKLTVKSALRRYFTRNDMILLWVTLVSLVLIIVLTPITRNQSQLNLRVTEAEALENASSFFETIGHDISGYNTRIAVKRDLGLLNKLNTDHGQRKINQELASNPNLEVPTHYFQITLRQIDHKQIGISEITDIVLSEGDEVDGTLIRSLIYPSIIVTQSLSGKIISLDTRTPNDTSPIVINPRFRDLIINQIVGDSIGIEDFEFEYVATDSSGENPDYKVPTYLISPDQIRQTALHYLSLTGWAGLSFSTGESAEITYNRQRGTASISFMADERFIDYSIRIRVTIDKGGNLRQIESSFLNNEGEEASISLERISSTIGLPVFVVMVLLALIILVRRFSRGLIDATPSKVDALFGAAALFVFLLLNSTTSIVQGESIGSIEIIAPIMGTIFGTLGGWLLIFFLSVYASSLSQEVWPYKLKQLNLIRKGYLLNQPVGMTLIRSVLYGIILTGLITLLVAILPDSGLKWTSENVFLADQLLFGGLYLVASGVFSVMLILFFLFLGLAALVYRRFKSAWATIGVVALFWAVSGFIPVDLIETHYTMIILLISGSFIGFILWKNGPILASLTYIISEWLWVIAEGLWISQNPDLLNLLFLAAVPVGLFVFGLYGITTNITSEELPDYTPAYLLEIANRERMVQELKIARQVQLSFLPEATPSFNGLELAANCYAAHEVGGDYYDFLPANETGLGVVIGDVSGKGIQAAFYMTLIKGFTKSLFNGSIQPAEFLGRVNRLFYDNSKRGTFISMIYGLYQSDTRTFRFARAGHNPLIVVRSTEKRVEMIESKGLAIGMVSDDRFDKVLECKTLNLDPGDMIILYTDGYTEAMNIGNRLYGDKRLLDTVARNIGKSAEEMLEAINTDVRTFIGERQASDDMTMIVMRVRA